MCASTTAMWASLGVRELATKPGARPTSDSRLLPQTAPVDLHDTTAGSASAVRPTAPGGPPRRAVALPPVARPLPRPSGLGRHYT